MQDQNSVNDNHTGILSEAEEEARFYVNNYLEKASAHFADCKIDSLIIAKCLFNESNRLIVRPALQPKNEWDLQKRLSLFYGFVGSSKKRIKYFEQGLCRIKLRRRENREAAWQAHRADLLAKLPGLPALGRKGAGTAHFKLLAAPARSKHRTA